ncbi:MAG: DUF86 domain-containing protein, partial [Nitrospinae bacterium]|nr:DUF86 domain-containing protein [Nitrospinota bacterium]
RLTLIGELSRIFRTDNVDVVILNEAPPLLAYEVLRGGVLLHCADEHTRVEFQLRTLHRYEDTKPLRGLLAEALAERIRAGTFGKPVLTRRLPPTRRSLLHPHGEHPSVRCPRKEQRRMALNNDTIRLRLQLLEGYVQQLQSYRQRTLAEVRGDIGLAWAIEQGLQLSIQCIIDVCHYLVAGLALGAPATSQDVIELLRDAGVFPADFAQTLVQMARLRNILVHVYAQVDVEIVYSNLQTGLDDFARFAQCIADFLAQQQPPSTH